MKPMGSVRGTPAGTEAPGAYVAPRASPTNRGLSSRSGHTGRFAPGSWVEPGTYDRRASGLPSPSSLCVTSTEPSNEARLPTRNVLHAPATAMREAKKTKTARGTAARAERGERARRVVSSAKREVPRRVWGGAPSRASRAISARKGGGRRRV